MNWGIIGMVGVVWYVLVWLGEGENRQKEGTLI